MPFNGSGVYSAPSLPGSFNPAISGQDATPADWNTLLADLSSALSQTITSNGESTITQDIPMNSHKFTGVSNASARTQFPSMGQIQDGGGVYAADAGTANAMAITLSPALTTYAVGQRFRIKKGASANTTAVTLNVNGIGAGDVKWPDGSALGANAIPANAMFDVEVQDISTPTAPVFHLQTVASPPVNGGGTITGTLTMSGAAINEAKGADIASASTINLTTTTGNVVDLTGTTTVNAITLAEGAERVVRATAATVIANSANLVLIGGANITTAAGDYMAFRGYAAGVVRMEWYQRANGSAPSPGYVATNSTGYSISSSYSSPMTITEGTQLFSTTYTPRNGSTVIVSADVFSCFGQNATLALSIFKDGATNAVATGVVQFPNVASAAYPARVVYSFVSTGAATPLQVRIAGGGTISTAFLAILEIRT